MNISKDKKELVDDLPEFESFPLRIVSGCVQVRLAEDDHPDVCVEIDFPCLGAGQSEVDEVSEPLPGVRVSVTLVTGHVECPLAEEGLQDMEVILRSGRRTLT
jgi:hypothetical protein